MSGLASTKPDTSVKPADPSSVSPTAETTSSSAAPVLGTTTSSEAQHTTSSTSTTSSRSTSSTSTSTSSSTTSVPTTSSTSSTTSSTSSTIAPTVPTTSSTTSSASVSEPTNTSPSVVIVTQTQTDSATTSTASSTSALPSTTTSASLSTSTAAASSGLSSGGKIAVAVVVPVASVALIILAALWFWRKRKANKAAEEERRKEVEEYGFNPNNDPTLPGVLAAGTVAPKDDTSSGYRGWGTTSAGRKASTNLSSGMGMAMSEGGGAYHHAATPSEGTVQYSDGTRPDSGEVEPLGVLGAAPIAANNRGGDIHRGPSNASSAYSAANRSEASEESHMSAGHPSGGYYGDNPYYGEINGHGAYGGEDYQPVIRDVQARRNTRIENPGVYPRSGNAGIAQNF